MEMLTVVIILHEKDSQQWSSQRLGNRLLETNDVMTPYYNVALGRILCLEISHYFTKMTI